MPECASAKAPPPLELMNVEGNLLKPIGVTLKKTLDPLRGLFCTVHISLL